MGEKEVVGDAREPLNVLAGFSGAIETRSSAASTAADTGF